MPRYKINSCNALLHPLLLQFKHQITLFPLTRLLYDYLQVTRVPQSIMKMVILTNFLGQVPVMSVAIIHQENYPYYFGMHEAYINS